MNARYDDFLRDVIITIQMNIRELRERKNFAEPAELAHIEAKQIAYEEVLSILSSSADAFNIPRGELGF